MPRAIALFSGGLDSTLAIRLLQEQGFVVDALNVRTPYACCKIPAAQAAAALGVELTVQSAGDDYLDLIRRPQYGYGRGMNPCIDCRAYMGRMAKRLMQQRDACVVITGEIVGQRPLSQRRVALSLVEHASGLAGRLLRPLSARLLPPTIPEIEGVIDRERLFAFSGRGRKGLIELARRLGIDTIPGMSTGCALTEVSFAPRVRDLVQRRPQATRWDFDLLGVGRHLRVDPATKVIVGRNAAENAALDGFFAREDAPQDCALLRPENFPGPSAMVVGPVAHETLALAGALVVRFARRVDPAGAVLRVSRAGSSWSIGAAADPRADKLATL